MSGVPISANESAMLINTRLRVVWTSDERRLLDRLAKIFNMHGDRLQFRCGNETCLDDRIILAVDASAPGGAVLRCGCTDRHFVRSC
jgi:hypothetical protein